MTHHERDEHLILMRRLGLVLVAIYAGIAGCAIGFLLAFVLGFVK